MSVSKETLQRMLREFGGVELSDDELERALPTIHVHLDLAEQLRKLDLTEVRPARLMKLDEGRGKS